MSPKHPRKAKETMCALINKVLHCSAKYYKNKCLDYWGPKPTLEKSHGETVLKCPEAAEAAVKALWPPPD